jgi:Di-haem cytochrome c peroxidase
MPPVYRIDAASGNQPVPGRRIRILWLLLAIVCLNAASPTTAQSPTLQARQEPITPIPAMPPQDPRRLVLGERLFSDPRLSHDGTHSCSSCHDIRTNGASANAHDLTPEGLPLALNTPTIFNAGLNFRLNWEGNVRSFEDHAEQTLRNPAIMASSANEIVSKLRARRSGEAIPRRVREGTRRRRPPGCDRDLRALPCHAGQPVRPLACGRSRRNHVGGTIRL